MCTDRFTTRDRHGMYVHTVLGFITVLLCIQNGCQGGELPLFTQCDGTVDMDHQRIHQGELALVIRGDNTDFRTSCIFTINAGPGKHVMFYFTELYLGAPNKTYRTDRACIELRDKIGEHRGVPKGIKLPICSRTEVEIGSRVYYTTGSALIIDFYRNRGYTITVHYKLVFTSFRVGSCRTSERKCNNERCIDHDLVCNDYNPCGDFSDCPTGLEHLSSWAMSGIVILALLSGGIVIIMATVCLQRSGNKRYDLDDFSSVSIGPQHNESGVEMNEVTESDRKSGDDSYRRDPPNESSKYRIDDGKPVCNGTKLSVAEPADSTDRERLIRTTRKTSESCSGDLSHTENNSLVDFLHSDSANTCDTVTTTVSSYNFDNLDGASNNLIFPSASSQNFPIQRVSESYSFSDNTLVRSDSESGGEIQRSPRSTIHRSNRTLTTFKMPSTSNGALFYDDNHVFTDFTPADKPAYGYIVNNRNNYINSPSGKLSNIGD